MSDDTIEPFGLPAVGRKKLTAAFDGGRITSDGGVMLLAAAERRIGIAQMLAPLIADPRDPALVRHSVADILRARMLAIACGYEDADDLDHLRHDPAFKLACGRLPVSGADLCSQPTVSRWENAPTLREVVDLMLANKPDFERTLPDTVRQNPLTSRQMVVLAHLQRGSANKIIAHELDMSESTVKVHVRNIMRKVGATNRTQAVYKAQKLLENAGLAKPLER